MRISIIVAVADNGVIGRDDELPWRLSADLRRFKALTMGHHLVVGRKTWESIGHPLPGRRMLVLTRGEPELPDGVEPVGSLDEAVDRARRAGDDELFVGGGAAVYEAALERADRLYLTRVHAEVEGDVRFPEVDLHGRGDGRDGAGDGGGDGDGDGGGDGGGWREVRREEVPADERNEYPTTFVVYDRRS